MRRRILVHVALLFLLAGCAGTELEGRATSVRALAQRARDNGAYRCAPRELALAEAHTTFAEQELTEGDYFRAKEELAIADENARAALKKSPKDKCAPRVAVVSRKDTDGDGFFDDEDACPEEPEDKDGYQDDDGCPEPDNDADGILDPVDKCPNDPEDADGFEDEDGCPELDNDADGLADKVDQCPNEAEDEDGFEDDDGCPDPDNDGDKVLDPVDKCPNEYAETPDGCPQKYKLIVVTEKKIELKQKVFFDTAKATIKPVSYPLLNEVADALRENATIKVRIEGHTDSRGSDRYNKRLSQKRADSVKAYLVAAGIDATRMEAVGFGEEQPIADNRTSKGREQNRRVEFVITDR